MITDSSNRKQDLQVLDEDESRPFRQVKHGSGRHYGLLNLHWLTKEINEDRGQSSPGDLSSGYSGLRGILSPLSFCCNLANLA